MANILRLFEQYLEYTKNRQDSVKCRGWTSAWNEPPLHATPHPSSDGHHIMKFLNFTHTGDEVAALHCCCFTHDWKTNGAWRFMRLQNDLYLVSEPDHIGAIEMSWQENIFS